MTAPYSLQTHLLSFWTKVQYVPPNCVYPVHVFKQSETTVRRNIPHNLVCFRIPLHNPTHADPRTSGPALYESLLVFPNTSHFVVTVNMGNNTLSIARDEIAAAIEHIGTERIRAFERACPVSPALLGL